MPLQNIFGGICIIAYRKDGKLNPMGTGFILNNDGSIVTTAHLLDPANTTVDIIPYVLNSINDYQIVTPQRAHATPAEIVEYSPQHDLALLRLSDATITTPLINIESVDNLHVLDDVVASGYPFSSNGSLTLTTSVAKVSAKVFIPDCELKTKGLVIDHFVHKGESGSPVFNPRTGGLCGIVRGNFNPHGGAGLFLGNIQVGADNNLAYVISAEYIKEML